MKSVKKKFEKLLFNNMQNIIKMLNVLYIFLFNLICLPMYIKYWEIIFSKL